MEVEEEEEEYGSGDLDSGAKCTYSWKEGRGRRSTHPILRTSLGGEQVAHQQLCATLALCLSPGNE